MTPSDRLIINVAITGIVHSKTDSPHLPVSPDEIAACVRQVRNAGASIVHLHARDRSHLPTSDGDTYRQLVQKVRSACPDIIVCASLSGRRTQIVEERAAALTAKPDLASLSLGSMNLFHDASLNPPTAIEELASRIYASGALPELEAFEAGHVNFANYLIRKNVLRPPCYINLMLGALGTAPLDLVGLGHMLDLLPSGAVWSAGGVGRFQLDANVIAIASGGHVRTGLEDNTYYDRTRTEHSDNARLVERIVRIARDMGREPATPDEARSMIGLAAPGTRTGHSAPDGPG